MGSNTRLPMLAAWAALILSSAGPAAPRTVDDAPSTAVISLGTTDDATGDRQVQTALYQRGVDARLVEVHHGADPFFDGDRSRIFGDHEVTACEGDAQDVAEFERLLLVAEEDIVTADYHHAATHLAQLRSTLPCLTEPVDPARLHRLYLLEGVANWSTGDRGTALLAFLQAVALDDAYDWQGEFGPAIQELHVEALRTVLRAQRSNLRVSWSDPDTIVYVDGRPVELSDGQGQVELHDGHHLLQVVIPDTATWTRQIALLEDVVVIERAAFQQGLMELTQGDDEGAGAPVLEALGHWMEASGYNLTWVLMTDRAARAYSEEAGEDGRRLRKGFVMADPDRQEVSRPTIWVDRFGSFPWRNHIGFEIGGGFLIQDRKVYAFPLVEVRWLFPSLPMLGLGVAVGLGVVPISGVTTVHVSFAPMMRIGPDYGPLRPFGEAAGVVQQVTVNEETHVAFGWRIGGGLVVRPARRQRFGLSAAGTVGNVDQFTFGFKLGVSWQW